MKTSVVVLAVLSLAILVSVSGRNVVQARDVWPGPDGVTATDGIHPGEAVITWSTVEKAAYYRIGWVAQADREVGTDGDAKWREGFVFADVANRGQASHLITGLAPGVEYDFVVASHDGHLPKAPQPVEVAALRLREDVHPNEYAPPGRPDGDADRRLVAGGGVPLSVDFQNSGACESTAGSGTVTMFGEDVNRYLCEDTQGSIYRIFVPVQYTSADAIAQSIHRRTNDGMQNREKRVAIYKALILELAIQKALQDRNHEDVYVDFLQTGRDISNDADEVADYVRAGYDLADLGAAATSELAQHIDHVLHSTTLELGGKLGTHAFDVAMAAAVNRTIDIQTARGNVWLLAQLPVEDPAWDDAIVRAGVDLDQMVSEHALDRWGEALEQNFEEIKRTVAILIAKKVAVTAVHALGAKIVIVTAPISLTVGLAATAGVVIFFETGDFWKDLSLASVAAQVFWDTHQHGNETDADAETRQGLLDYAQFSFYQHTLQAADNVAADLGAIWNLGDRTPTQFYLSILARRDLALAPLTGSRWEPAEDFKTLNPDGKRQGKEEEDPDINQDPRGLWANEKIMWVQDAIDGNIYAYDFENKARVPTRDIGTTHTDVDGASRNPKGAGIWSDGNTMWTLDTLLGRLYAYRLSDGSHSRRQTWYRDPQVSVSSLEHHPGIGLWSDRTTMWIADHLSDRVYAYVPETRETDDHGPLLTGARVDEKALFGLSAVGNEYAAGIWSDGTTMWVADKSDAKVYAYDLATGRQDVTREFALLDVPGIVSNTNPSGIWSDGTTMWVANEADPDPGRFIFTSVIEALGDILAEQLANLGLGDYSASDQATRVLDLHGDQIFAYELPKTSAPAEAIPYRRNPAKDLARMASAGNDHAEGIWSDGTTMWVADHDDDRIYAYRLSDGTRDEASGFDLYNRLLFEGNHHARGIWSDGTTMWVADHDDDRIYAYRLSDGARVEELEFGDEVLKAAGNEYATGIWFDVTTMTMWVADRSDDLIYGYDKETKTLVRTIDTLQAAGNHDAEGIWSDGTTMWVADHDDDRVYAYRLSDGARMEDLEFDTPSAAGNQDMKGIWSDGTTMWVADQDLAWVYAYHMPPAAAALPLGNPTNLTAAPGSQTGEVALSWSPAANATVQWVYLVKPDGTDGRYWPHALAGDAATLTITGLDAGETYYFLVIAGQEQADGTTRWSQWSNWGQAIPAGPSPLATGEANFTAISSGASHTCGLRSDGSVACWGSNDDDQATPPAGETFSAVSSGGAHTCGLRSDGSVACWGGNEHGQATPPADEILTTISSGGSHTCGLRANGTPVCWGKNTDSNGRVVGQSTPPSGETFAAINGGGDHTCALRTNGTVRCWGSNRYGASSPPNGTVLASLSDHSYNHTCGLDAQGTAICWGISFFGVTRPPTGETFSAVGSGDRHTCGLRADGSAICWGSASDGHGRFQGKLIPPEGETFTTISVGWNHTCGITTAGAVACWGDDSHGQSTPPAELSSNTLSSTAPDLVVRSPSVSNGSVLAGETFTFSADVYNREEIESLLRGGPNGRLKATTIIECPSASSGCVNSNLELTLL